MDVVGITGSSGYVGSLLSKRIEEENKFDRIIHIGRSDPGYSDFIEFDMGKDEPLSDNFPAINKMVHTAAYIPTQQDNSSLLECEVINGKAMLNLLRFLEKDRLNCFINISSCHIWNPNQNKLINNAYEGSKLSAEIFLKAFAANYGFNYLNLRFSYVYGPFMKHGRMFRHFIKQALDNKAIDLFNEGKDEIHLVHRNDAVDAILMALQKKDISGTFDICNYEAVTTLQIADAIVSLTGSKSDIRLMKNDKMSSSFYLNPEYTEKELGVKAKISLEDGISSILKEEYGL